MVIIVVDAVAMLVLSNYGESSYPAQLSNVPAQVMQ